MKGHIRSILPESDGIWVKKIRPLPDLRTPENRETLETRNAGKEEPFRETQAIPMITMNVQD